MHTNFGLVLCCRLVMRSSSKLTNAYLLYILLGYPQGSRAPEHGFREKGCSGLRACAVGGSENQASAC